MCVSAHAVRNGYGQNYVVDFPTGERFQLGHTSHRDAHDESARLDQGVNERQLLLAVFLCLLLSNSNPLWSTATRWRRTNGTFFRSRTHESWEKKKPAKPNENKETYSPLTRAILLTGPDGVRSSELTSCPSDEGHFLPFKIYETVVLGPLFPTAVVLLSAVRGMPNQHQPVLSPRLVPVEYIFKRMKLSQIRYQLLRILFYMGSRSLL